MSSDGLLKNQVALVTGSGRGIGLAIARKLASSGAQAIITDISQEAADAGAKELKDSGLKADAFVCNVTDTDSIEKMTQAVIEKYGKIDILVNNAGITRDTLIMRMKLEDWNLVIETNLSSVFKVSQIVLKHMSKAEYGRIVNIASVIGIHGNVGQANYAAAKGGVIALTKTIAKEYAKRNVTCNAIAPGFIDTAMTQKLKPEIKEQYMKFIPLGRFGQPEDVAKLAHFFCTGGSYITGQAIEVDGGMFM
ncbi:MAG: 3-oxoacyl-[acyl-carrier-protein] reductase [Candidatus Melainabacteria bacterium]|nr:3-oxoacyl-[acyl-carrier-protein] reductase [Candidatus Melainabacteria bacterium]MBI3308078.1 3-oxoacyl-[acyl-carrier-protein] reductase [Candidatus Melainabacteria bacterium]